MTTESGKISGDCTATRAGKILVERTKLAEQQRLFGFVQITVHLENGKITHISEDTHRNHK